MKLDDILAAPAGSQLLSGIAEGKITRAEDAKPRKVSRPDLENLANELERKFATWPASLRFPGLWITGSHVWTAAYGLAMPESADIDVFTTTRYAYDRAREALSSAPGVTAVERPAENRSHARGVGVRYETELGPVDLWTETESVFDQLARYPADGYAHCRVAWSPFDRAVVVMPNDRYVEPRVPDVETHQVQPGTWAPPVTSGKARTLNRFVIVLHAVALVLAIVGIVLAVRSLP